MHTSKSATKSEDTPGGLQMSGTVIATVLSKKAKFSVNSSWSCFSGEMREWVSEAPHNVLTGKTDILYIVFQVHCAAVTKSPRGFSISGNSSIW